MTFFDHAILFSATFANVFFLGFQSKNVNQSRYFMAFSTSWGITLAQYFFVKYAAGGGGLVFVGVAGVGGSLGIVAAIFLHDFLTRRRLRC